MGKNVRIYYWKAEGNHRGYLLGEIPSPEAFKKDYAMVWEGSIPGRKGREATLDDYFEMFNNYDTNPLSAENRGQGKLRALGVGHTSMSMGDVIEKDGKKWLCDWVGWKDLGKAQAKLDLTLARHVVEPSYEAGCRHQRTEAGRCVKCGRMVMGNPRLTR